MALTSRPDTLPPCPSPPSSAFTHQTHSSLPSFSSRTFHSDLPSLQDSFGMDLLLPRLEQYREITQERDRRLEGLVLEEEREQEVIREKYSIKRDAVEQQCRQRLRSLTGAFKESLVSTIDDSPDLPSLFEAFREFLGPYSEHSKQGSDRCSPTRLRRRSKTAMASRDRDTQQYETLVEQQIEDEAYDDLSGSHPLIEELEDGTWVELRCQLCPSPGANSTTRHGKLRYFMGLKGFTSHLANNHKDYATSFPKELVLACCRYKDLSAEEIRQVKSDCYQVPMLAIMPEPSSQSSGTIRSPSSSHNKTSPEYTDPGRQSKGKGRALDESPGSSTYAPHKRARLSDAVYSKWNVSALGKIFDAPYFE
ncbi:hypothetical protein BDV96DRAFT_578883 [Lophiotrema nucula]|uniref:Uncharacterized protein n=1 Tax=Lophiotrema nucula TaxID=690887 RepID=A0A6A5Z399_9PLEO|nr:hypothetical protein BDV96DRAFT_578883 [Lophiotrema nucula]